MAILCKAHFPITDDSLVTEQYALTFRHTHTLAEHSNLCSLACLIFTSLKFHLISSVFCQAWYEGSWEISIWI